MKLDTIECRDALEKYLLGLEKDDTVGIVAVNLLMDPKGMSGDILDDFNNSKLAELVHRISEIQDILDIEYSISNIIEFDEIKLITKSANNLTDSLIKYTDKLINEDTVCSYDEYCKSIKGYINGFLSGSLVAYTNTKYDIEEANKTITLRNKLIENNMKIIK